MRNVLNNWRTYEMSEIEKGVCSLGRTPLKVVMRLKPAKINAKKKINAFVKTFLLSDVIIDFND